MSFRASCVWACAIVVSLISTGCDCCSEPVSVSAAPVEKEALSSKALADEACPDCPICAKKKAKSCCEDDVAACADGQCPEKGKTTKVALADDQKGGEVPAVLNFNMETLDGKPVKLSKYQGKVVVFVNVASQCGYTPQYKALQSLHDKYASKGLAVVGVPSNDFGRQEPGSNEEIAEFCQKNYGVKFDMLSKVVVKGSGQAPLYQYLTSKETNPKFAGPINWNFEKFVINREGQVVARFPSKVKPDSPEMVKVIEAELAKS